MRIVIATTFVPFASGGDRVLVDSLERQLRSRGHTVETFSMPFHSAYPEMLEQMAALRTFDFTGKADRVIAVRTPSYLVRHPSKVAYFLHHHRGAYDLWGTEFSDLPDTCEGHAYRAAFVRADDVALSECVQVFSNSQTVARRLLRFNNIHAEVLYPPLPNPERFHTGPFGDYMLYVSRLADHKRQHLAVEAMGHVRTEVKLVVCGQPVTGDYQNRLTKLIDEQRLGGRVELRPEWISEPEKARLLSNALACVYIPFDEDSYGYPTLEAFQSGKAVVTVSDSGGPLELITDGENGLIAAPNPQALAGAFDALYEDRGLAARLGAAAQGTPQAAGITWDRVLSGLLS